MGRFQYVDGLEWSLRVERPPRLFGWLTMSTSAAAAAGLVK